MYMEAQTFLMADNFFLRNSWNAGHALKEVLTEKISLFQKQSIFIEIFLKKILMLFGVQVVHLTLTMFLVRAKKFFFRTKLNVKLSIYIYK